jgi:hypothetical protein
MPQEQVVPEKAHARHRAAEGCLFWECHTPQVLPCIKHGQIFIYYYFKDFNSMICLGIMGDNLEKEVGCFKKAEISVFKIIA